VIGRVFDDRYEVIRMVGSGGMADVYLAKDRVLGRKVALKVLSSRLTSDSEFVERFRREASAAASLNHPNIVQVYDKGEAEGTYYIAMEFLEGRSLKDLIVKYAPLELDLIISISRQIVEALRYVHRRDIIHRDIKPQNIIIDDEGRVKVTDFGIALSIGGAASLTEAGTSIGTAQYLSPEQAQGQTVEAASDLYSLGVVMYEMATGRLPFDGENSVGIAMQHVNDAPVPPRDVVPDIPENLEMVILRALTKRPAERYLTAQAMLDDIWKVHEGKAVEPPRAFTDEGTRRFESAESPSESESGSGAGGWSPPAAGRVSDAGDDSQAGEPLPDEFYGRPPNKRAWLLWGAVGVLLLALIITALAIWAWGGPAELGVVPNVIGMTLGDAEDTLADAGFKMVNDGEQASADVPEGRVADQKPDEGMTMSKGDSVHIWVSSGQGRVIVTDVVGWDRYEAIDELEALGLVVLVEEEPVDETDKINYVQRQEPAGGSEVEAESTVTIWVGVPANMVLVPSVVGMSQSAAEAALNGVELIAEAVEVDSELPGGTVVAQDPSAGTQVETGSTVVIEVSNAPPSNMVTVPPVAQVGLTEQQAKLLLDQYYLKWKVEYYETNAFPPDIVFQQDPVAGTIVPAGTIVTITVAVEPVTTTLPPTTTTTAPPTTTTVAPTTTTVAPTTTLAP